VKTLLRIPLAATVGLLILGTAALAGRAPDQGALAAAGTWSLVALYAVIGAVGGGVLGVLSATGRGLDACAAALRDRLQQAVAARQGGASAGAWPAAELRARYDELVDRMVAESIGRVPLPRTVLRWFRGRVRRAVLGDYVDALERRGGNAGPADVTGFLLGRGLSVALEPAHAWLRLWRTTIAVGLVLLAAIPLAARLL
jgi:hypothetical protein